MQSKIRRGLVWTIATITLVWILASVAVFVLNDGFTGGWLLLSSIVYAILFIIALALLFAEPTVLTIPPPTPHPEPSYVPAALGPEDEVLFETRRGQIEIHRVAATGASDLTVMEEGRGSSLDHVEAALDNLRPTDGEAVAPVGFQEIQPEPIRAPERRPGLGEATA